jgi:hypothetical protein
LLDAQRAVHVGFAEPQLGSSTPALGSFAGEAIATRGPAVSDAEVDPLAVVSRRFRGARIA